MIDARGIDSDIVELLRSAAMNEKSVAHLLALLLLTEGPSGENDFTFFTVMWYFEDAFDWSIRQMGALKVSFHFADKPWPDEVLNARYAPLLEAWRQNPTPPRPSEAEEDAALFLSARPISDADAAAALRSLEMS